MKINVSKTWNKIIECYFNNENYSMYNDPNITYQELVLIDNIRHIQHNNCINAGISEPILIIDTNDFYECEQIWNKYYLASFYKDINEKEFIDWNKVITKRNNQTNIMKDQNGKYQFFWNKSPYKEEIEKRSKKNYRGIKNGK